MKSFRLLVWLTQLGLSAALPLIGFVFLGIWLHQSRGWGKWVVFAGLILGVITGLRGLWDSLKAMERMAKEPREQEPPPASFNDHS